RIVGVHFAGGIGRDSAPAHHQHLAIEGKRPRLARGPWYGSYRAGGVSDRAELERVSGVDHRAAGVIRRASDVDHVTYGACGWVHDPFRRVYSLWPLGAYGLCGIKLPDLVSGGYVDVEPAEDI